jgi:hypothetical protein
MKAIPSMTRRVHFIPIPQSCLTSLLLLPIVVPLHLITVVFARLLVGFRRSGIWRQSHSSGRSSRVVISI